MGVHSASLPEGGGGEADGGSPPAAGQTSHTGVHLSSLREGAVTEGD